MEAGKRLEPDAALDELELWEESATSEAVEGTFGLCDADEDEKVDLGGKMLFADHNEVLRNLLLKVVKTPLWLAPMSRFARVVIVVL